ncbi:MAG: acyltransferase [Clostridia bacterium]
MQFRENLHRYRNEIKGIAILWVVFFHAKLGLTSGVLYEIQKIGYGGVDIFLFLAGFGLYHSLQQSNDMRAYLSRRMRRLLPAYLPFCLCWLAVMLPLENLGTVQSIRMAAGNLLMLGYFANVPKMISWYISLYAVVILLAPLLFACLSRAKKPALTLLALLAAAIGLGFCFLFDERYMAVSRLPILILGMAAAMPHQKAQKEWHAAAVGGIAFAVGYLALSYSFSFPSLLSDYGMYWHPFFLMVPGLCAAFGWLLQKAKRFAKAFAPLRFLGEASFEIFLFNCWMEMVCKRYHLASDPLSWALWSLGSIAAGCCYHVLVKAVLKAWRRKKQILA